MTSCLVWNNVENRGRVRYVICNVIWHIRCEWEMRETKIQAHSLYLILFLLHGNNGYANAPHFYNIRTLPVSSLSHRPVKPLLYYQKCKFEFYIPNISKTLVANSVAGFVKDREFKAPTKWLVLIGRAFKFSWNLVTSLECKCRNIRNCKHTIKYEGWNFNSGNYLFTTDTK